MADNITLSVGTGGAVVRTDEDSSNNHWQYVKVAFGADNTQTIVSSTNPLPVAVRSWNTGGSLVTTDLSSKTDDTSFGRGADPVLMVGGTYIAAGDNLNSGDAGAFRLSENRSVHVALRDAAGNERGANINSDNQLQVEIFDGGDSFTVDNAALSVTGSGTESDALRVTIATDSSGTLTVDGTVGTELPAAAALSDNTVNPTVPGVGAFGMYWDGSTWDRMRGTGADGILVNLGSNNDVSLSGTLTVTDDGSFTLAANSGVDIGDVDVTSVVPGTGATNLGKAEDAAHASGDVGVMALAVRRDSNTALSTADGDYVPLLTNATGALKVDGAFSLGANSGVDIGDVDVTSVVPGVGTTNLGKARNAVAGSSDVGVAPMGVRDDTLSTLSDADGDYTPLRTNNRGAQWVTHDGPIMLGPLPSGSNYIGDVGAITMPAVRGSAAHDSTISGNPVPIAARANANEPSTVSSGDATYLWSDQRGRLVVINGHPNPVTPVRVNATSINETTLIAAPGSGQSLYICKGSVHNSDAATEIVGLREASGSNVWEAQLAADGGGSLFDFGSNGWKLTANTALAVNLASAGDVTVNVTEYYIAP